METAREHNGRISTKPKIDTIYQTNNLKSNNAIYNTDFV